MSDKKIKKKSSVKTRWSEPFKYIALGSVAALLMLGLFWVVSQGIKGNQQEQSILSTTESTGFDSIESGAVVNKENAERTLLNQKPPAAAAGDKRREFRIIEVIPHDACSIFPYMIEWGSREEYDKNVPIGYEGLFACARGDSLLMFTDPTVAASDSSYYTKNKAGVQRDYLENYDVPFGNDTFSDYGAWYRMVDQGTVGIRQSNGYYEFVGAGKGLYYVATSYVAEKDSDKGIHYEVQAINRKGGDAPKGEMYVKDPAYYLARDHSSVAKPQYNSKTVLSQTGYNYNISFAADVSGIGTDFYKADTDKVNEFPIGDSKAEYLLEITDISQWQSGLVFQEKGDYVVQSVTQDDSGDYVRVKDLRNTDKYTDPVLNLDNGYFARYESSMPGNPARYNIIFELSVLPATGYYAAKAPSSGWPDDDSYQFVYAGSGKGRFDVPFLYVGDGVSLNVTKYKETVIEVSHNGGRYALTSTGETALNSAVPVYADTGSTYPKDYAKVITKIDFYDAVNTAGQDNSATGFYGVSLGGKDKDYAGEKGGWVFHPITDMKDMDVTFLSKLEKNNIGKNSNTGIPVGTRVYVYGQTLRHRYYCRNGFTNNEWFKLLCYSNNPKDPDKAYTDIIDGVGYDFTKTAEWNLNNSRALLNAFDQSFRIVIEQVTPDKLTPEKVRSADLLYISRSGGIAGITSNWAMISNERVKFGEEPLVAWPGGTDWRYPGASTGDIDTKTLFTIYDECIYKRNVALMLDSSFNMSDYKGSGVSKNLVKLYYLMNFFHDARNFAKFMPDMYPAEAVAKYTKINGNMESPGTTTTLDAYMTDWRDTELTWHYQGIYNYVFKDNTKTQRGVSNWFAGNSMAQFMVYDNGTSSKVVQIPFNHNENANWNTVLEDETKLVLGDYLIGTFKASATKNNVWKILKNRNREVESYEIVVEPVNADMVMPADGSAAIRVIYGNEFDPASFDIQYQIMVMGSSNASVTLSNVELKFENGTVIDSRSDNLQLEEVYTSRNVRSGFAQNGSTDSKAPLNPAVTMRTVTITATDMAGVTGSAEVRVIVREAFDLN